MGSYAAYVSTQLDDANKVIASLRAKCDALRREVEVLRRYGNKTCTAMADDELAKRESDNG